MNNWYWLSLWVYLVAGVVMIASGMSYKGRFDRIMTALVGAFWLALFVSQLAKIIGGCG